jgi:hypothetical protein
MSIAQRRWLTGRRRVRHRIGMVGLLLTRNRALDHGRVVNCACPWARRPDRTG